MIKSILLTVLLGVALTAQIAEGGNDRCVYCTGILKGHYDTSDKNCYDTTGGSTVASFIECTSDKDWQTTHYISTSEKEDTLSGNVNAGEYKYFNVDTRAASRGILSFLDKIFPPQATGFEVKDLGADMKIFFVGKHGTTTDAATFNGYEKNVALKGDYFATKDGDASIYILNGGTSTGAYDILGTKNLLAFRKADKKAKNSSMSMFVGTLAALVSFLALVF